VSVDDFDEFFRIAAVQQLQRSALAANLVAGDGSMPRGMWDASSDLQIPELR
jgi:hypothetical protein